MKYLNIFIIMRKYYIIKIVKRFLSRDFTILKINNKKKEKL